MSTVYQCFQRLVPQVITNAEDLYQETLRGTDKEALVPALIGRLSYDATMGFGNYIPASRKNRILVGLGLSWALCTYKGFQERTWMGEWGAIAFLPAAQSVVNYMTGYYSNEPQKERASFHETSCLSRKNNERLNFALKTAVLMVQAYALYKFKGDRNPSLPVKPYLYYGAGVVLLTQLKSRYADKTINSNVARLTGGRPSAQLINTVVSQFLIGSLMAYAVRQYTGDAVQINRTWEALSPVGVYFASTLLG